MGKNTILKAVSGKNPEFHRAVTYTTREPRPEEIPGEDHYFVYLEKFEEMIKNGEFLEYAKTHGDNIDQVIRNRIKNDPSRGQTTEEEIQTRIATARKEAEYEKEYDYSVVNPEGRPEEAIEEAERIIQNELK